MKLWLRRYWFWDTLKGDFNHKIRILHFPFDILNSFLVTVWTQRKFCTLKNVLFHREANKAGFQAGDSPNLFTLLSSWRLEEYKTEPNNNFAVLPTIGKTAFEEVHFFIHKSIFDKIVQYFIKVLYRCNINYYLFLYIQQFGSSRKLLHITSWSIFQYLVTITTFVTSVRRTTCYIATPLLIYFVSFQINK